MGSEVPRFIRHRRLWIRGGRSWSTDPWDSIQLHYPLGHTAMSEVVKCPLLSDVPGRCSWNDRPGAETERASNQGVHYGPKCW
jgi:hypothetical protein